MTVLSQPSRSPVDTQRQRQNRDIDLRHRPESKQNRKQNLNLSALEKGKKEEAPNVSASTFDGSFSRKVFPQEISTERTVRARNNPAAIMHAIAPHLERSPLDIKIEIVETACLKRGILVSADGFIRQADAANLLAIAPHTLRNRRLNGGVAIAHRLNGKMVEYSIVGIAAALLAREERSYLANAPKVAR